MNYEKRVKAAAEIIFNGDAAAVVLPEVGITATLKPHQVEGLSWLIRKHRQGVNVILGDEMGLGKTLQAISFLSYLKIQQISPGPFLVLCPLSVTDGWTSEIDRFAPELKFLKYIGDKEHRKSLREEISGHVKDQLLITNAPLLPFDVLLTTYDIALKDQKFLSQIPWHYAVIDEAQRLKSSSSVLYHVLIDRFLMPRRLLMTGTPIQNNLTELWALLHFCMPSIFGTLEQFLHTFKETEYPSLDRSEAETNERFGSLKYVLKAFMLRRTKSELIMRGALTLPSVTEITVMAPMAGLQKTVYMSILRKELSKLLTLSSGATNHPSLQNIVIQLRKACSHPYLFPGIEPEPYEEGEHLVQASGKLMILDQLLKKLHGSGHRVLLFAQMTHTLDILQDFMELRKYSYERLDGSIRAEERFAAIRSFSAQSKESSGNKAEQDGSFVFLISTRAGGVGLNLVAADTVIFFEQDWNPQVDKQALQRAHRIGQLNSVLSINLVTGHTVEEVIMRRAERKLQLCNNVIGDYVTSLGEREAAAGVGYQDLRSVIFGLQIFDPLEMNNEILGVPNTSEMNNMIEKIIGMRHQQMPGTDDRRFEISSGNMLNGSNIVKEEASASNNFDAGLDEASYNAWVEKFKEMSQSSGDLKVELASKRKLPKEKQLNIEASRKKSKEKKLVKWKALGYHTLSVEDPIRPVDSDTITDSGSVNFVYGDCTQPARCCPSEPTVIFSCVDDSGKWGRGGMFDALAKLSANVPEAYERASEFGDLHLGDAHLVRVNDESGSPQPQWVALAVVQSYNSRRKAPRSKPCLTELECCLEKVSFLAAQHSASIHMPRIGYGDGSEWYTVERLLRKYASIYGINIFVYYFRPSSSS